MKTTKSITGIVVIIFITCSFIYVGSYPDGTYNGVSRARYTNEEYYGIVQISVENDLINKVDFIIRDSANHETFNENYEDHFIGNEVYIQQCRDNWAAIPIYIDGLLNSQNVDEVDAIGGATWAYNLFSYSVHEALKDTEIPDNIIISPSQQDNGSIQVFPNPFKSAVTIKYNPGNEPLSNLQIIDMKGSIVKQMCIQNNQSAGEQTIVLDEFSGDGIYYYRLRTGNNISCNKIVKIKSRD